jgi:hypothetical protein
MYDNKIAITNSLTNGSNLITQSLWFIASSTRHVVASGGLIIVVLSAFARLIAAIGTLDRTALPDMKLFGRIFDEIGDEILGSPGALPTI